MRNSMIRTISTAFLLCLVPACGAEASGAPSDERLLATNPGGLVFHSVGSLDTQEDCPVPAFLFGEDRQIARGVSKPVEGAKSEGGGKPVRRWGLWHYYHLGPGAVGEPDSWGKLGQRGGLYENGEKVS